MKKRKKGAQKNKNATAPRKAYKVVLPRRKPGQPTIFNIKVANTICSRLSGGESLRSICRDKNMPAIKTVMNWLFAPERSEALKQFVKDYELAREMQADVIFEETAEIADTALHIARTGVKSIANARINALRVQIDTRKWFLSHLRPKKYSDKIDVTSGGKEIKQPRAVAINYGVPIKPKTA